MCTQCSIGELQAVRPELTDLYELEHLQGQAQRQVVMQVAAADEAARGKNIVGLAHDVAVSPTTSSPPFYAVSVRTTLHALPSCV